MMAQVPALSAVPDLPFLFCPIFFITFLYQHPPPCPVMFAPHRSGHPNFTTTTSSLCFPTSSYPNSPVHPMMFTPQRTGHPNFPMATSCMPAPFAFPHLGSYPNFSCAFIPAALSFLWGCCGQICAHPAEPGGTAEPGAWFPGVICKVQVVITHYSRTISAGSVMQ